MTRWFAWAVLTVLLLWGAWAIIDDKHRIRSLEHELFTAEFQLRATKARLDLPRRYDEPCWDSTPPAEPLPALALLEPAHYACEVRPEMRFAWIREPEAVSYQLDIHAEGGFGLSWRVDVVPGQMVYEQRALAFPPGRYTWNVRAFYPDGHWGMSARRVFTVPPADVCIAEIAGREC